MNEYTRICPECNELITYKTRGHKNYAERKQSGCRKCQYKHINPAPNVKCGICQKPIYRIPSKITHINFCSYGCRNKYFSKENSFAWKGGSPVSYKKGRVKDKERKQAKKLKAVELLGGKCSECGYNKCMDAIDFHHIDPLEKDDTLRNLWVKKWGIIEKEIKKCVLLCSNCHREHHWKERNNA